ncbi:MAG TPA: sigma-70 family RNA polymerase sigma factor [Fimbriiglobus sp.]|nr:sigma-70 family RNA polymerase sigma factor [Fimbriiglobus sp.]
MPEHLVRFLRSLYASPADGVSDAELLRRCAAGRDDAAFELLVRRHAALVWRVCRSVARDHHAAEDAFQAAFLALARRPGAVRDPSAAGWLSRVAYHAALKTRGRPGDAHLSVELPSHAADPADMAGRSEVALLLHAELNRLPEKYRLPVVLCHLHGFTQQEAARQLGLPVGTVATRISRGLDRLRDRLTRRGVAVPAVGGLFAASAVSPALTEAAVRIAESVVPAHITRLAQGALAAMTPVKWKLPAAALVAATALGTAWAVGPTTPSDKPTPPAKPTAAAPIHKAAPSTYAQREQSRKALQQIAFAVHAYHDAHGHIPGDILDKDGKPLLSWRVAILPQLDNEFLYSHFKLDEPWDSEHNKKLLPHMPKAFRSPVQGVGPASETYFQGFAGPAAGFQAGQKLALQDFADGTSNTIMLAEAGPPVPWTKPTDRPYDPKKPLPAMDGPYSDRFITVFWDGAVRDLRWNLNEKTYRALIGRADGIVITDDGTGADRPRLPLPEEDKKLIEWSRKYVEDRVRYIQRQESERLKLLDELKATGGVPEPAELGPNASVEDWKELEKRLGRRERLLWDKIRWMREELAKRKKERSK